MNARARVLIVDDKKLVRDTIRDTLYGFDCIFAEAPDGTAAIALLGAFDPHVTILDLKLQDMSGLDVIRAAQQQGTMRSKVIVLTGLPEPSTREEAERLGVFAYLAKPIVWAELRGALSRALPETLPISAQEHVLDGARAPAIQAPTRVSDRSRRRDRRPRILVLDDNVSWLDSAREVLADDFNVTVTISAKEAVRSVRTTAYDLVLLDKNLPGLLSGIDTLEQMRKSVPGLRAVILTEKPDRDSLRDSFLRGAVDYVSKVETKDLREIVHRILAERRQQVKVFLSYERTDRAKVSRLFHKLTDRGFLPWMDYKSIVGGKWEPQIRKEIARTDFFVFCLSPNSLTKEGTIRKEVRQALDRQEGLLDDAVFFLVARLDECDVIEPFSAFQYFDVFKRTGFAQLVRALSNKRGSS